MYSSRTAMTRNSVDPAPASTSLPDATYPPMMPPHNTKDHGDSWTQKDLDEIIASSSSPPGQVPSYDIWPSRANAGRDLTGKQQENSTADSTPATMALDARVHQQQEHIKNLSDSVISLRKQLLDARLKLANVTSDHTFKPDAPKPAIKPQSTDSRDYERILQRLADLEVTSWKTSTNNGHLRHKQLVADMKLSELENRVQDIMQDRQTHANSLNGNLMPGPQPTWGPASNVMRSPPPRPGTGLGMGGSGMGSGMGGSDMRGFDQPFARMGDSGMSRPAIEGFRRGGHGLNDRVSRTGRRYDTVEDI